MNLSWKKLHFNKRFKKKSKIYEFFLRYLQIFNIFRSDHDGGDEEAMYIGETDSKTGIGMTEPVNVDISNHVNRRTGFSVPENPL